MSKKVQTKRCGVCKGPIPKDSLRRLYCSPQCADKKLQEQLKALAERRKVRAAEKNLGERPCEICGVLYAPQRTTSKYCSKLCREKGFQRAVERQRERRETAKVERSKT